MTPAEAEAIVGLLFAADRALPLFNVMIHRDEITALEQAVYRARVVFPEIERQRQALTLPSITGDCTACQGAVIKDASLLVGREWVGVNEQMMGPPYHWAKMIGETQIRNCYWDRAYEAACGKTFRVKVDTGD